MPEQTIDPTSARSSAELDPAGGRAAGLHPECPDLTRLGPTRADAALRGMAARQEQDVLAREKTWSRGFTRRRLLAGAGAVGVAAIGSQLVSTRVSFAAPGALGKGTVVVVFLRGGMDGLSVVVPADDPNLLAARPGIAVRAGSLLPLDRGFGLHPALKPLYDGYYAKGMLSAVPAISTPDLSRSHFQAQDCLERGGASISAARTGWLDRVLESMGPGTTFRAIGEGGTLQRALTGSQGAIALQGVESFNLRAGSAAVREPTLKALRGLYTGVDDPLATQAILTLDAVAVASQVSASKYEPAVPYPDYGFANALKDVARLIKADLGLRIACVDVGGWDMHTNLGTVDKGDMQRMLTEVGASLTAFAGDLGEKLGDVTVVTMSEFGRRIEQNDNAGTDHGHGGVALLLGGGVVGRTVHGSWDGLPVDNNHQGDVPGSNDYRDLLGDVVTRRLGVSEAALPTIFPGHTYAPLGTMV